MNIHRYRYYNTCTYPLTYGYKKILLRIIRAYSFSIYIFYLLQVLFAVPDTDYFYFLIYICNVKLLSLLYKSKVIIVIFTTLIY